MKTQMILLKAFLTLVMISVSLSAQARIFSLDHYEQAKKAASIENKLLMLRFTAKWCLPCQFMEKNVFNDYNFSSFLEDRSIQVIVDVENFKGMDLKDDFMVSSLPTIIFLNPDAIEVSRKNTSLGITDMKYWVESLVKQYKITVSSPNTIILNSSNHTESQPLHETSVNVKNETSSMKYNDASNLPTEKETENKIPLFLGSYYVQMGAFDELENAMKSAEDLDAMFSQNASIYEDESNSVNKLYKINLGPFDSEEEAVLFTEVLKDRKIDALVKKANY